MKKLSLLLIAIMCCFALTACGPLMKIIESATGASDESSEVVVVDESEEESEEESEIESEVVSEEESEIESEVESEEVSEEESEEPVTPPANAPTELSDDIYSFQVQVDGVVHQFPMWFSEMEALGWTFKDDPTVELSSNQYTFAQGWTRNGVRVYTNIANLTMNSATLEESAVCSIKFQTMYLDDGEMEVILPQNIKIGEATKEDIIAAYGEPSEEYEGTLYYKLTYKKDIYEKVELYVYNESGVLEDVEIVNMIELEGGNNEIDDTVPQSVLDYKAPEALSDDLTDMQFALDGNVYALPCPVSVFMDNGFELVEDNSQMEYGAGDVGYIEFRYDNQKVRCMVRNYEDYATVAQNCFVVNFKSSEYSPTLDVELPGGIKLGTTEAELLAALDGYAYEIDDEVYYTVVNPAGRYGDEVEIYISEGKVYTIEIQNDVDPYK